MFFVLLTVLRCSDSIFSLLKRVTDSSFLFSCKTSLFPPLPFLNLGTQIRCPQNPNTDLKSAVEQPLLIFLLKTFLTILTFKFFDYYMTKESSLNGHKLKQICCIYLVYIFHNLVVQNLYLITYSSKRLKWRHKRDPQKTLKN